MVKLLIPLKKKKKKKSKVINKNDFLPLILIKKNKL